MNCRSEQRGKRRFHHLAALPQNTEIARYQGLRSGRAKADDHLGTNPRNLGFEPRTARRDLPRVGLFMNPKLAALRRIEMFYDIGDVHLGAIDTSLLERVVEQLARRADERMALDVFSIAGLFADEHHFSPSRAFAEDRLRRTLPDVASTARLYGVAEFLQ